MIAQRLTFYPKGLNCNKQIPYAWKACGVYYLKTYFPAGVLLNFT